MPARLGARDGDRGEAAMSSGSGRSVTAGHGHLVWSLAAIILALIAPFGELPALSSDRYWLSATSTHRYCCLLFSLVSQPSRAP
jgi:hypothetical protein